MRIQLVLPGGEKSSHSAQPAEGLRTLLSLLCCRLAAAAGGLASFNALRGDDRGATHELICPAPPLRLPFHAGHGTPDSGASAEQLELWRGSLESLGLAPSATLRIRELCVD